VEEAGMSMRARIAMSDQERRRFLAEEHSLSCATIGPNGRPHLIQLWYRPEGDQIVCWTYAKSQKVRNLERDPRATLQIEAGDSYGELRGVMLECDVDIDRDPQHVLDAGIALADHHSGEPDEHARAGIAQQAPKRVVLRFTPTRIASWDHRKLD
jgi:PPOX class probable F420-dependent enzyme